MHIALPKLPQIRIYFLFFESAIIPPIKLRNTWGNRDIKRITETKKLEEVRLYTRKIRTTFIMLNATWEKITDRRNDM